MHVENFFPPFHSTSQGANNVMKHSIRNSSSHLQRIPRDYCKDAARRTRQRNAKVVFALNIGGGSRRPEYGTRSKCQGQRKTHDHFHFN